MKLVLLTAIGVGMATVFGSVIGFFQKAIAHLFGYNFVICGRNYACRRCNRAGFTLS